MIEEKNQDNAVIFIDPAIHAELNLYRALDSRKKKTNMSWDQFFDQVIRSRERNEEIFHWVYTIGIFFLVTLVITLPIYIFLPSQALLLFPVMVIIGFIVALFTAYLLTPFSLRHFKPYQEDPQITEFLKELAKKAQIKLPKLLVAETPEINALAFVSPSGGRVCVTRGFLDAYHQGEFSADELKAILGHEIGHIKHGDCLKWSFILSWLSIFDVIGTICLLLGSAFIAVGGVTTVLSDRDNSGPLVIIVGIGMVIVGIIQRVVGKIASLPAYHMSRKHEYAADLAGAQLVSPEAHISALHKIETHNNLLVSKQLAQLPFADQWQTEPRNVSWIDGLFSTHPPIEKRIEMIKNLYQYL